MGSPPGFPSGLTLPRPPKVDWAPSGLGTGPVPGGIPAGRGTSAVSGDGVKTRRRPVVRRPLVGQESVARIGLSFTLLVRSGTLARTGTR